MCKVEINNSEIVDFERDDPWGKLRSTPGTPKKTKLPSKKNYHLSEPEKTFSRRRRESLFSS